MSEYIEKEALIAMLEYIKIDRSNIEEVIKSIPTLDIVHCEHCCFRDSKYKDVMCMPLAKDYQFCSRGMRKDANEKGGE